MVWTRVLTVFAPFLIIRKIFSSQAEISHTFMEMFLNLICFTDFYFIETLTSLFWFFQRSIFHSQCYLKSTLLRLQHYHKFSRFFFWVNCIVSETSMAWTLRTFEFKHNTKHCRRSTWIIHFDGLCNYLYSFQNLVAASFFININCYFPDKGKVGHHTSIFTEAKVHFMWFFAQRHLVFKFS